MNAPETLSKPGGGLKEKAKDALLASLRRQVDDLPKKPGLAFLKEKQQGLLLNDEQISQFVLKSQKPGPTQPLHEALVDFLRSRASGRRKKYTIEELQKMQRLCQLNDKQLKAWVIDWWEKKHKPEKSS